ncbi:integrase, catalytic region, zinc finger, CCHC-type containing protein [Tanacetum coccineum]
MLAPKCATYNGRLTFANPRYLKKAQSEKPCLYEIPYDNSDHANRFAPEREETMTLENESRSKLNKDKVKPYDYTNQNSLYIFIALYVTMLVFPKVHRYLKDVNAELESLSLVPQGQKASDYDNSDPVPPRQNVVPYTHEKADSAPHQEHFHADHVGCIDTREETATSRGIQFLGDKLVCWMSKKHKCTAMSFCRGRGRVNKNALADTGSDINTMPFRLYVQLGRDDMKKVDRGITMINHTQAEAMGILPNVLCQVGVTTLVAKFLILDILIDRDSPIVVGRGFLRMIGAIVNTRKRLFSTFDGFCHQTFRAARSDFMRNAESDSDDEEEYQIKRNKFGAPIYGPKPAP